MKQLLQRRWAAVALTMSVCGFAHAAPTFSPVVMTYDVAWGSVPLGQGTLSLTATDANDCYQYELRTKPVGLVKMLYGAPRETSNFCVVNGTIVPSRYESYNSKREKDSFVLDFDWVKGLALGGRNGPQSINPGTLDRFAVHQASRMWVRAHAHDAKPSRLEVAIVDHKRVKNYTFAITGRGTVSTPSGDYEAVRFERVDDKETTLRFWLAPAKDYMPVKVEHVEDGESKLSLTLQ